MPRAACPGSSASSSSLAHSSSSVTRFFVGSRSFWFHAIGAGAIALVLCLSLVVLLDLTYPFSGDLSVGSKPFQSGTLGQFFAASR